MKRIMASSILTAVMALSGCDGNSAGLLQKFLDTSKAYSALPAVKRTPAYRLVPVEKRQQWYYICDGDRHIGLQLRELDQVALAHLVFPQARQNIAKRLLRLF